MVTVQALLLSLNAVVSAAPEVTCDGTIQGVAQDRLGYRLRGDRCEGIYWQPHSTPDNLPVLSIQEGNAPPRAPTLPSVVRLSWSRAGKIAAGSIVRVRAVQLRPGLYYRMDTTRTYAAGGYDWSTDVVRDLGLGLHEVAVLAMTQVKAGALNWNVVLPASVGAPGGTPPGTYTITVLPGVTVHGLSWRCLRIQADGTPGAKVAEGALSRQLIAGAPVSFSVVLPTFRGLAYLELNANPVSPRKVPSIVRTLVFLAASDSVNN